MYTQKAFLDIKGYGGMCIGMDMDMDRQREIAAAAVAALMVVVAAVEEMV